MIAPVAEPELNTVQRNIRALIDREELTVNGWALKHELVQSTINRIVTGKLDPSSSVIERIAGRVGMAGWQLMVPGMNAANPPALRGMTTAESDLYARLQKNIEELALLRGDANTRPGELN